MNLNLTRRSQHILIKTTWFIAFVAMSASCLEQPDCFALNNNIVQISFKKLSDRTADAITFQGIDAENTSSIFYGAQSVAIVNLPLDYLTTKTTYTFRHSDTLTDKLTLTYLSKAQFVSDSCGQRFVLSNLKVIKEETTFDSVRVLSDIPFKASTTAPRANFEIYR